MSLLSLDGVAEEPDRFITDWEEVEDAHLASVIATQDAVILGRRSTTSGLSSGQTARWSRSPPSSTP